MSSDLHICAGKKNNMKVLNLQKSVYFLHLTSSKAKNDARTNKKSRQEVSFYDLKTIKKKKERN